MSGVVVTGTGAVSAAGTGVAETWAAMGEARACSRPVDEPAERMPWRTFYPAAGYGEPTRTGHDGRARAFLAAAADEALRTAGHPTAAVDPRRVGVVLGTGMGASGEHEARRVSGAVASGPVFGLAGALADGLGAAGPAVSVTNACAAGAYAIAAAVDLLESDECDVVLAAGAEGYSRVALAAFNRMGAVDPVACRPFAADRAGTAFGEGAGVLVLERSVDARARGARVLARVLGHGLSCDADHPTAPDPDGAQAGRALRLALERAGLGAGDVAAVVPHGTGTHHNDLVESQLLRRVLGGRVDEVPLYSLKALVGHTGGAAGALGAVVGVEIARRRTLPGNVDVGALDPACDVLLPRTAVPVGAGAVVVNAYAFGGNNASVVLAAA